MKKSKPILSVDTFRTPDNLVQSACIMTSAATILRIAHGEICSCNALVESEAFSDEEMRSFNDKFTAIFSLLERAYVAFRDRADALREESRSAQSNS